MGEESEGGREDARNGRKEEGAGCQVTNDTQKIGKQG